MMTGVRLPAGATGVTAGWPGQVAVAVVWRCRGSRLRFTCRLYFRLIRVGSLTFAHYRVNFSTQVKDGDD
jgi:hypothetical protein